MKSFNIFIEQASRVGVGSTGRRWHSLNYRYGYGLGHEGDNENGGNEVTEMEMEMVEMELVMEED